MKMNKDQFFSALVRGKVKNFKINGVKYYSKILERDFYVDKAYLKSLGKAEKNLITSIIGILKSDVDSLLRKNKYVFLESVTKDLYEMFDLSTKPDDFEILSKKFKSFLKSFNINDYKYYTSQEEQNLVINFINISDKNFVCIKIVLNIIDIWTLQNVYIKLNLPEDENKYYTINIQSSATNKDSVMSLIFNSAKNYLKNKIIENIKIIF